MAALTFRYSLSSSKERVFGKTLRCRYVVAGGNNVNFSRPYTLAFQVAFCQMLF